MPARWSRLDGSSGNRRNSLQSKANGAGKIPGVQETICCGTKTPALAELLTGGQLKHSLHRVVGFVSARRQSKRPQSTQGISKTKHAPMRRCNFGAEIRLKVLIFHQVFCESLLVNVSTSSIAEAPAWSAAILLNRAREAVSNSFSQLEDRNPETEEMHHVANHGCRVLQEFACA